eukprot:scaffold33174_cov71-Phaeocystis_antarctica.AAC.3
MATRAKSESPGFRYATGFFRNKSQTSRITWASVQLVPSACTKKPVPTSNGRCPPDRSSPTAMMPGKLCSMLCEGCRDAPARQSRVDSASSGGRQN